MIGIVAGRIKERFGRPAIVIAETEDGTGKGSGRSIRGVDLGAAVLAAKDSGLLVAGGGHAMAAGLTLAPGGLEPFREFINERLAADVEKSRGDRALLLDALLAPGGVAGDLCDALDAAGPYGAGWPSPRVAAGPARLLKTGIVGNGHVRGLACGDDGKSFKWIAFRSAAPTWARLCSSSPADQRWWLAGTSSATNRTAAMRRRCTWRTPRLLDPLAVARLTGEPLFAAPSSSGLGRRPFTAKTRVRVPLGSPLALSPRRSTSGAARRPRRY